MFEKNLKLAYLLDFYGDVLDEHTRNIMKAYYDDDLSLAEIAEGLAISRQGVRHIIKKGEDQLEFLESRLGLAQRNEQIDETLSDMRRTLESLTHHTDPEVRGAANSLLDSVDSLHNKN